MRFVLAIVASAYLALTSTGGESAGVAFAQSTGLPPASAPIGGVRRNEEGKIVPAEPPLGGAARPTLPGGGLPAPPHGPARGASTGTGFSVSHGGHILTNNHVVAACAQIVARLPDGLATPVTLLARDVPADLALLLSPVRIPAVAPLRGGQGVRAGDDVIAVGFPLAGLLATSANVTTGNVSALAGLRNDPRFLQMTTPVQPGNSGGPLLDLSGNVVGVITSKLDALRVAGVTGDIPQNVNFSVKIDVARAFLDFNRVEYVAAPSSRRLDPADIGELAQRFTMLIECRRQS